jgi:membrane-associated protease RseP (regulator of RpoE activity)
MTDLSAAPSTISSEPNAPSTGNWRLNLGLFFVTALSVFWVGAAYSADTGSLPPLSLQEFVRYLWSGWSFAVPLLVILLCHEFGHWIAARLHGVPASFPYFLPLPFLSPFGTLGAVIAMPERIRSRSALLDIGAAGPLAGLVVAIPALIIGLSKSELGPLPAHYMQEGQSLLYALLKQLTVGDIPQGYDVMLHPTAYAGWAGLLVTMINLLPWGQLDGGHIMFALLGPRHNRIAPYVRLALLVPFAYSVSRFVVPVLLAKSDMPLETAIFNSLFWLLWFVVTGVMGHYFGKEHPPFEPGTLSPARKCVAILCLTLFVLLFMPIPSSNY